MIEKEYSCSCCHRKVTVRNLKIILYNMLTKCAMSYVCELRPALNIPNIYPEASSYHYGKEISRIVQPPLWEKDNLYPELSSRHYKKGIFAIQNSLDATIG